MSAKTPDPILFLSCPTPGGFCDFKGHGLWGDQPQSMRWVGIISNARGIDRFLANPRGERTWDISQLQPGDCIQGGGYDTNSRGRRRNETTFFAVVVRCDDAGLTIAVYPTRSAALAAARERKP